MVSKRWTWLSAFGLLFAGLTNAHSHVHYCFDGQEPPAAIHLTDGAGHHHQVPGHHDDGAEHDDLDLDVPNQALAKLVKHDLPAIEALVWTTPVELLPSGALAAGIGGPPHPNPRYALPRLRAPPR